ncbi:substrate-binding domain-containing protein [Candidatus Magnetaquicoccus inordinatus]|uniref:substrate-binding domain-containing protein n=1 Tax=Candidatus Magnetaquicoccus inordinatus TaxID=2496818 RepID=UPI00102AADAB|nr:substrate-binding domain-containing protein [Candidatus Magnetaquicoccus inordinatus]
MKRYKTNSSINGWLSFLLLILAVCLWQKELHAEHIVPTTLRGPAFSHPDEVLEKSEEWQKQPIRYREQDLGAEVVLLLDQNIYPGLLPLIQEFARNQRINVSVREGTCGPAAEGINRKEVDIGGSCCPAAKVDRLPGLQWHTIGISPLAILVHDKDPLQQLTATEVRDIYRGKISRWSHLENIGKHYPKELLVRPVTRLHCKIRPGHWRLILDNEEQFGSRINEVGTILDMVTTVAKHPGTIGYLENWQLLNDPRFNNKVRAIAIDGQDPTDTNTLKEGRYPFYWVYNVSTWSAEHLANGKAQQLVEYLMANAGRVDPSLRLVPATELRKKGWQFRGNELIGEP